MCGCKYSWEGDLATVAPTPSPTHIAFPEVTRQTSLKYHPGLQPASASGGVQLGSPQGSALIYGGAWHSAINQGIHQITSWEDSVHFVRAGTLTRGG